MPRARRPRLFDLLPLTLVALLAGCIATEEPRGGAPSPLDDLALDTGGKADAAAGLDVVYLGSAELTRAVEERAIPLPEATAGTVYVLDLHNGHPEAIYDVGMAFYQAPAPPEPGTEDLGGPPATPVDSPPLVHVYGATEDEPMPSAPRSCIGRPCPYETFVPADSRFLGEFWGAFELVDNLPEDLFARLVFVWPEPIWPGSAGLAQWCIAGCE
jgi:hypothetical protein